MPYANGKGANSRHTSSGVSVSSTPTILLAVALIFYLLGFIQSIRHLPDVHGPESLQSASSGALGRALLPLAEKVRPKQYPAAAVLLPNKDAPKITPVAHEAVRKGKTEDTEKRTGPKVPDAKRPVSIREVLDKRAEPKVPEAKWPVSIRDELDNFETIMHPGDGKTEMSVPKFWSDPVMTPTGPLMSRDTAMKVGSYDTSNGKKKGSLESRTIFIAIASYRDFQCRETLDSILKRAKYPERVRIGG